MFRFKTQRRRPVIALTLIFAVCAAGIVPAATTTTSGLPVITSVQLTRADRAHKSDDALRPPLGVRAESQVLTTQHADDAHFAGAANGDRQSRFASE